MRHALIIGARGVGKSTLIERVLKELGRPVWGFESKKETELEEPERGCPVYIYEAGMPRTRSAKNLVGYCKNKCFATAPEVFDHWAPRLCRPVPEGSVVKLDEIGFMESSSRPFCEAVLALLDGEAPVIAAVKDKDYPFLQAVRSHPNCRCFHITRENREELAEQVLAYMREQTEAR